MRFPIFFFFTSRTHHVYWLFNCKIGLSIQLAYNFAYSCHIECHNFSHSFCLILPPVCGIWTTEICRGFFKGNDIAYYVHSSALTCHLSTSILARKTDFNSSLGVSLFKHILYKQVDPWCVNIQRVFLFAFYIRANQWSTYTAHKAVWTFK